MKKIWDLNLPAKSKFFNDNNSDYVISFNNLKLVLPFDVITLLNILFLWLTGKNLKKIHPIRLGLSRIQQHKGFLM